MATHITVDKYTREAVPLQSVMAEKFEDVNRAKNEDVSSVW
jgi:hypothetical protein